MIADSAIVGDGVTEVLVTVLILVDGRQRYGRGSLGAMHFAGYWRNVCMPVGCYQNGCRHKRNVQQPARLFSSLQTTAPEAESNRDQDQYRYDNEQRCDDS